jgi:hypothetical protein
MGLPAFARHRLTQAGPGRPPGLQNRLTMEAKEMIERVQAGLGGYEDFLKWASKHRDAFYQHIYPRLLPLKVHGVVRHEHDLEAAKQELSHFLDSQAAALEAREVRLKLVSPASGDTDPRLVEVRTIRTVTPAK